MMTQNNKKWFTLVVLIFVMIVAGMVSGISVASAAAKPVQLRMMVSVEPTLRQMSPVSGFASESVFPIVYNIMEPLVDLGKKGEPVPKLATKWEQRSPTTWRFYLRKGVKFHNGADFTARDVVEYVKWNFEEKSLSKVYAAVPAKEAVAVDDYTVDLILEKPRPLLLIDGRYFLVPPAAISRDNRKMAETQPIGTGPYRFVEWNRGLSVKLTKFENYWGPKPQIDDVAITFREESAVRLAALMAGEVDWVFGLSTEQVAQAPKAVNMPSAETVWFRFDESIQKNPILVDKRLRLAIEYAIDRKALVAIYGGFITPSLGQFASPGDFGFNPNIKSRPYDLEKAKALVREAGAAGKTVTFVGPTDRFAKSREVAEAVAHMIEQSGLKVKLMLLPNVEVNKYKNKTLAGLDMVDIVMTITDTLLEVESRFPYIFSEGGSFCAAPDPESTKLHKDALAETNYAKRGEKVGKAWAYVYEQAHYVPLFKPEALWGIAKNLDWKPDIAGRPFFADMRFTDR